DEGRFEVDVDDAVPLVFVCVDHASEGIKPTRGIDQDVNLTKPVDRLAGHTLAFAQARQVRRQGQRAATGGADLLSDALGFGRVAAADHCHVRALGAEPPRHSFTYPRVATGHNRRLAAQLRIDAHLLRQRTALRVPAGE